MGRETVVEKAKRLLGEGRLTVLQVSPAGVVARCKGDTGDLYLLGWDPQHRDWRCSCEANASFGRRCSHLRALQLVTVKPQDEQPPAG